jgi:hypothetical protein
MILHKATFEKFGYRPKALCKTSHKLVISRCPSCMKSRSHMMMTASKVTLCAPCSRLKTGNNNALPSRLVNNKLNDIFFLCDLFYSCNIVPIKNTIRLKQQTFRKSETSQICDLLEINILNITNLKNALYEKLIIYDRPFELLNYIFQKHRTLTITNRNCILFHEYRSHKLIQQLMNNCKFIFKPYKQNGAFRIIEGSFFINGGWIHT